MRLVAKEVEFHADRKPEVYHALAQADYISILAITPDGRIPIVRQYRPAVEDFTYELPAGLVEPGETPLQTCSRELLEETGLIALRIVSLGTFYSDTGRMENSVHVFQVETSEPNPDFVQEEGLSVEFLTKDELRDYVKRGLFRHQLHLGVLATAAILGNWTL